MCVSSISRSKQKGERESERKWKESLAFEIIKRETKPVGKLGAIKNDQLLTRFLFYNVLNLFLWLKKKVYQTFIFIEDIWLSFSPSIRWTFMLDFFLFMYSVHMCVCVFVGVGF